MQAPKSTPRKAASLEGSLRERPYEQLVAYVEDRALTGSLVFTVAGVSQGILVFVAGRLARAATRAALPLSGVLYELGLLETEQLNDALRAIAKSHALFGDEVVRLGMVPREAVDEAIAEQLTRKLSSLSVLPETARFAYYHCEDLLPAFGRDDVRVSVARGVMRGLRTKETTPAMRDALERLGESRVVFLAAPTFPHTPSGSALAALAELELTDEEAQIAADCVEPVALELVRAHRDPRVVDRLLYALFLLRRLRTSGAAVSGQHGVQATTSLTFRAPNSLAEAPLGSGIRPRAGAPGAPPVTSPAAPSPPRVADRPRNGPPIPVLPDARALLRAARAQVERGDFRQSLATLESLRKETMDLEPDVEVLYAWTLANVDSDPESTKRARVHLSRVLVRDPRCSQAYYYFALLERREGRFPQALRFFKKAVEMDPQNLDALRELRLFNMRVERGATPARAMSPAGGMPAVRGPATPKK